MLPHSWRLVKVSSHKQNPRRAALTALDFLTLVGEFQPYLENVLKKGFLSWVFAGLANHHHPRQGYRTAQTALCSPNREGYTKNQAVKNMPMASRTTVRWGNTAGFTGLVYLVIASSSCSQSTDQMGRHSSVYIFSWFLPIVTQNVS